MSEATHYWPSDDKPGVYDLVHDSGATWKQALWTGDVWVTKGNTAPPIDQWEAIAIGYLGVRREQATLTPTPRPLTPDPDDGNAMVAQEALNELRMCRKSYQFERWSIKWGRPLTERLGAR
jgi:hypothetical protein